MAKGKGQVQLQLEVETEEDWKNLIVKDGLILVDVYTEWCGPCSGMAGNLRKIKLEQGGDTLVLAVAKCDNIQCLQRFRNKSRPTWMFISNSRMIRLLFGSNAPVLTKVIIEELQKTRAAMETKVPRTGIDFDQLTPEEQEIADKIQAEKDEQERIEKEARDRVINERREAVVQNLLDPMKEYNFVVVWPHIKSDGLQQIMTAIKDLSVCTVGKPNKYKITENDLHEMFFYGTWRFNELEIAELCAEEITALLFLLTGAEGDDIINLFLQKVYGPKKCPPGDENYLAVKLSKVKPVPKPPPPEGEPNVEEQERKPSLLDPLKLPKSLTSDVEPESEQEEETFMVPGVYVPENQKCKIIAMRILFPGVTSKFDLPEPEPIPPHLIVAFDAFKVNEIVELAEQYPDETMCLGFFSSAVTEEAKLLCKTDNQYDKLVPKPVDAKLVVKVSKMKSEPLLSYCALGPVYVSPNCVIGEQEAAVFFPDGYNEPEGEPEPEPRKKSKKKKKKAKTIKTSLTAEEEHEASPEGSEATEEVEEEGEGEYEDEGEEEEDAGDDDDDDMDLIGESDPGMESAPTEEDKATVTDEPEGAPDE